ncbi:MAG: hypothetical protein JWM21_3652 [Acidobacteria bacterium]|nr:hypothetical protein [Acidobacteriota bacterium]
MKRLTATTVLLGLMVLAFAIPVALLFMGAVVFILTRHTNGITARAGGFNFSLRPGSAGSVIIILMLAAFISWLTQKILKRRNSRR